MGDDHIAVLFNIDDEEALLVDDSKIVQCQFYIKQFLGIETTAVLGSFLESIMEISERDRETLERSNERFRTSARER